MSQIACDFRIAPIEKSFTINYILETRYYSFWMKLLHFVNDINFISMYKIDFQNLNIGSSLTQQTGISTYIYIYSLVVRRMCLSCINISENHALFRWLTAYCWNNRVWSRFSSDLTTARQITVSCGWFSWCWMIGCCHGWRGWLREFTSHEYTVNTHAGGRCGRSHGTLRHVPGRLRQGCYLT